jgi:hypothetical protein
VSKVLSSQFKVVSAWREGIGGTPPKTLLTLNSVKETYYK